MERPSAYGAATESAEREPQLGVDLPSGHQRASERGEQQVAQPPLGDGFQTPYQWPGWDLNPGPTDYESAALTS
jgi:hypothetical protein